MKLILCVGLPASGKSFWADAYCRANPGTIRINADSMRYIVTGNESNMNCEGAVWISLERTAEYLLNQGFSLVIDNLNYHKKARKTWIKLTGKYLLPIEAIIMDTPYEICVERNNKRDRKVPIEILEKVRDNWEEPTIEEGFNNITKINV